MIQRDGNVGVHKKGGGNDYCSIGRKLDEELEVPKDQVTALLRIEVTESLDDADTER